MHPDPRGLKYQKIYPNKNIPIYFIRMMKAIARHRLLKAGRSKKKLYKEKC